MMGRYNRFGRGRRGYKNGFFSLLIPLILAIVIGYVGTRFIVYPFLLQDKGNYSENKSQVTEPEVTPKATERETLKIGETPQTTGTPKTPEGPIANPTTGQTKDVVTDEQDIKVVKGFALQYGTFTEKTEANNLVEQLSQKGVNVYIYEKPSEFRVMGNAYESREKADIAATVLKNGGTETSVVDY